MSQAKKAKTEAPIGGPTVKLASGHTMPLFALGTWKSPSAGQTAAAVYQAIKTGYRNIDAANDYNNEHEVGDAIAKAIADGICTREELFVQCKLWNSNHKAEHVEADLQQSLIDLKLAYVDNFVIHWPMAVPSSGKFCSTRLTGAKTGPWKENPMFPIDDNGFFSADLDSHYVETWKCMEGLVERGLCKSIGLSNFTRKQIAEVVSIAKVPVSTLQNECHPYLQQKDLIDYCRFNGICFQAFSPLGSGDTHLGTLASPTGCIPLKDPSIAAIAEKYPGKNSGQVMLKWGLQRGYSVVSKSANPDRIVKNFELWDFEITSEDMAAFDKLNCGWRHLLWAETSNHPDYPFFDELPTGYKLEKAPTITSSGN